MLVALWQCMRADSMQIRRTDVLDDEYTNPHSIHRTIPDAEDSDSVLVCLKFATYGRGRHESNDVGSV